MYKNNFTFFILKYQYIYAVRSWQYLINTKEKPEIEVLTLTLISFDYFPLTDLTESNFIEPIWWKQVMGLRATIHFN